MTIATQKTDIQLTGWMAYLPNFLRPYAVIARLDRPIGWWLLLLPGWWTIILFAPDIPQMTATLVYFLLGAIILRASGCVINDMWDRDIDGQVARTAQRPLASGALSLRAAFLFLVCLAALGLAILLQLPVSAWMVGVASLPLIILYPLAKRITGWPQIVLGLTYSWGIFLGASCFIPIGQMLSDMISSATIAGGTISGILLLYIGTVFWVIGYDTIYAVQDMSDDKEVGVRSSALSLGRHLQLGISLFYASALCLWGIGFFSLLGTGPWILGWLAALAHLVWQLTQLSSDASDNARRLFVSNRNCGLLLAAGLLAERLM